MPQVVTRILQSDDIQRGEKSRRWTVGVGLLSSRHKTTCNVITWDVGRRTGRLFVFAGAGPRQDVGRDELTFVFFSSSLNISLMTPGPGITYLYIHPRPCYALTF